MYVWTILPNLENIPRKISSMRKYFRISEKGTGLGDGEDEDEMESR